MRCAYGAATLGAARFLLCLAGTLALCSTAAHATITVLIGEPFGSFGRMMPVGHTAIYLDRVCADGPLKVRMCEPGEPAGVVVARYFSMGHTDWVATPVMQFLYATPRPDKVLTWTTPEDVWAMRQAYRRQYLEALVPDGTERDKATAEWHETVGVAYDRKVWGYALDTTPKQDEVLVAALNADPNQRRYKLSNANCANFAADLINRIYPHAIHRTVADLGWLTPKQVAHCMWLYGRAHPELHPATLVVPQVPGTLERSFRAWGAGEGFVKIKPYVTTLALIQPEVPAVSLVLYLARGRFPLGRGAEPVQPRAFVHQMPLEYAAGGSAAAGTDTTSESILNEK